MKAAAVCSETPPVGTILTCGSGAYIRALGRDLPVAARAEGSTIWDTDGRAYLDGAGGAIVVNVGHGRQSVVDAIARQASAFTYVHGTSFTSEPLESYARAVSKYIPMDGPAIYPVSGHRPVGELPR